MPMPPPRGQTSGADDLSGQRSTVGAPFSLRRNLGADPQHRKRRDIHRPEAESNKTPARGGEHSNIKH